MMTLPPGLTESTKARFAVGATRLLFTVSPGVLAWLLVAGFAIVGFSQQVKWERFEIVPKEVLGFAYAFAVAGTITGVAAAATSGQIRWAMGWCAISIIPIAASVPLLRWLIFRTLAPDIAWAGRVWGSSIECAVIGSLLGMVFGLVISGLILVTVLLERYTTAWQFGVIVTSIVALLGMQVLPAAISCLSDLTVLYAGANYRYLYDEWLLGAGVGAGTGSLAGAIVAGLMARWHSATERGRHLRGQQSHRGSSR